MQRIRFLLVLFLSLALFDNTEGRKKLTTSNGKTVVSPKVQDIKCFLDVKAAKWCFNSLGPFETIGWRTV